MTGQGERPRRQPTPEERDEGVTIPLGFEEVVRGLLAVDPDSEPANDKSQAVDPDPRDNP